MTVTKYLVLDEDELDAEWIDGTALYDTVSEAGDTAVKCADTFGFPHKVYKLVEVGHYTARTPRGAR